MAPGAAQDYYAILGVPRQASAIQIRQAFRQKVLLYHPDRNPGNPVTDEKFKQLVLAYETISNDAKRARYDLTLRVSELPPPPPPPRAPAPRPRPQAVREPQIEVEYSEETSPWRPRDGWWGIAWGGGLAFASALYFLQPQDQRISWQWAACALPLVATPIGYRFGLAVRGLWADTFEDPGKEWLGVLLPYLFAWAAAVASLLFLPVSGIPNLAVIVGPAAAAAGVGAVLGAAMGRAFTSVSQSLTSEMVGLAIAAFLAIFTGGFLALILTLAGLGSHWGLLGFDSFLSSGLGGAFGAAVAAAWGALPRRE